MPQTFIFKGPPTLPAPAASPQSPPGLHLHDAAALPPPLQERRSHAPSLSCVVPCYNEAQNLELLLPMLIQVLEAHASAWEIILVDDGSTDATLATARRWSMKPGVRCLQLSRNFGKEVAIAAGLAHARGNAVILMDGDLQHPPETIPVFLQKWREGYLNVYGQRTDREGESALKRSFAKAFYRLFAM